MLAIKAKKDDLAAEEKKLKALIDKKIGTESDSLDVGGYRFIRETRQTKRYNLGELRTVLGDEDLVNQCLVPDNTLAKRVLKEAKVDKDTIKRLTETMDVLKESQAIKLAKINTKI